MGAFLSTLIPGYAESESTDQQPTYYQCNGINVTVLTGNIIRTQTGALASSDNGQFPGQEPLATAIRTAADRDFQRRVSAHANRGPKEIGSVIGVNSTAANTWKHVYTAVCPHWESGTSWRQTMSKIFTTIIEKAVSDGNSSVAFPLLGTGKNRAPVGDVIKVFCDVLASVPASVNSVLREVEIYALDKNKYDEVITAMDAKLHRRAVTGNQPVGTMSTEKLHGTPLEGYGQFGTIQIVYDIPSGTQGANHPSPGTRFEGTTRTAYLPDSPLGNEVANLLEIAFDKKLVFTVGKSVTTGRDNVVTWNGIEHKTRMSGGQNMFGYPDPDYLNRVKAELANKGVRS